MHAYKICIRRISTGPKSSSVSHLFTWSWSRKLHPPPHPLRWVSCAFFVGQHFLRVLGRNELFCALCDWYPWQSPADDGAPLWREWATSEWVRVSASLLFRHIPYIQSQDQLCRAQDSQRLSIESIVPGPRLAGPGVPGWYLKECAVKGSVSPLNLIVWDCGTLESFDTREISANAFSYSSCTRTQRTKRIRATGGQLNAL